MTARLGDCERCGRPVGVTGRTHCARCHYSLAHRRATQTCPVCGKQRVLAPGSDRCARCSRTCSLCGAPVGRVGRTVCGTCARRARGARARQPCPRCGKPGYLRGPSQWCGPCSRPGRTPNPDAACRACGQVTRLAGAGLCRRCWEKSPHRITIRAEHLAETLEQPPEWLPGFADYLVGRHHPGRATKMIAALGRLLGEDPSVHPQALLESAARLDGPLGRALEDFLAGQGLALRLDREEQHAARRRARRVDAVPAPLRPAVAGFVEDELTKRRRARRAGTKPREHHTIDAHLDAVRDLAKFLAACCAITDWATVNITTIEAFLALQPPIRAHRLAGLRQFFAYAVRHHLVLIDPTRGLSAPQPWGFRGPSLTLAQQQVLFRRWSTDQSVHPHEALVGLLGLLHGATTQQIGQLAIATVDRADRTITLSGRPQPTPLDPWTWTALENCLAHHDMLRSTNPHVIVTRQTRSTRRAASDGYVKHALDPVHLGPRILRSSRLLALVNTIDANLVASAYGMTNDAVTIYTADHVDPTRLANP